MKIEEKKKKERTFSTYPVATLYTTYTSTECECNYLNKTERLSVQCTS